MKVRASFYTWLILWFWGFAVQVLVFRADTMLESIGVALLADVVLIGFSAALVWSITRRTK